MDFRKLGNTGLDVSVIGMGAEHLNPQSREDAARVLGAAVDAGITYFDLLSWVNEAKDGFGDAFKHCRDDLVLVAHIGVGETNGQYRQVKDEREAGDLFNDLLKHMRMDHVEIAQLSNIDGEKNFREAMGEGGILEAALKLKKQGKARFIGYSGHDPRTARMAVESGHVDTILFTVNMVEEDPSGRNELLRLCATRGVGVAAMKTFAGGAVFEKNLPVTPVQCISYTLAQPGVATVAIGLKTVEQVGAAQRYLVAAPEERAFESVITQFQRNIRGTCVYCSHCLPCPSVIDIPRINGLLVSAASGVSENLKRVYGAVAAKASSCVECGLCSERCPFGVDVVANMREAARLFENEASGNKTFQDKS